MDILFVIISLVLAVFVLKIYHGTLKISSFKFWSFVLEFIVCLLISSTVVYFILSLFGFHL